MTLNMIIVTRVAACRHKALITNASDSADQINSGEIVAELIREDADNLGELYAELGPAKLPALVSNLLRWCFYN